MLRESDFEEYWEVHRDPDVTRFTTRTQLDRMDAWRHLAVIVGHWHLRGFGMWGVFENDSGRFAGRVGFHQPDGWPDFELGWTLGRAFWGKGYAVEAASRCVRFAFEEMDRDHLISLIDPANVASIRRRRADRRDAVGGGGGGGAPPARVPHRPVAPERRRTCAPS